MNQALYAHMNNKRKMKKKKKKRSWDDRNKLPCLAKQIPLKKQNQKKKKPKQKTLFSFLSICM
jgi:hypothetical protein